MACHFINEQDVIEYASLSNPNQSESDSLSEGVNISNPILLHSTSAISQISETDTQTNKIKLPKGGCQVITKVGSIQFSMVPETLKDSINLGLEVPSIFIVPKHRFDKRFCLSVAEFEFPAYFSFFVKKRRVTLITDKDGEQAIRAIFQETLLGPQDLSSQQYDFAEGYESSPDLRKELGHFAKNPFNPTEPLSVDTLVQFVLFDENDVANLGSDVTVKRKNDRIFIYEGEKQLAKIKNKVDILIDDTNAAAYLKYGLFSNPTDGINIEHYQEQTFEPPMFGVTVMGCSHGFDPKGSVSGYIFWINGMGIMLDPPPFTTLFLKKQGIPSRLVRWVIISHNHADHDAGTFQKLLESEKITLISTATIKNSFVRKYAAMTGFQTSYIESLFHFQRVVIGSPLKINGAEFDFHYSLHSIPCICFTVRLGGKSIYFSGDTYYEPEGLKALKEKGIFSEARFAQLVSDEKWKCDLILHEAGVPPIHTPAKILAQLPEEVKKNLRLIHAAAKDIPTDSGLQVPGVDFKNTIVLIDDLDNNRLRTIRQLHLLENIDLFQSASIQQVRQIFECARVVKFKANQMICQEEELGYEFFVVQKGTVKISSENKHHHFIKYLHYGDYFGEGCFFGDQRRRANVQAMTDCELIALHRNYFLLIFRDGDVLTKLEQLQAVRGYDKVIEKNRFFSQLTSNQKIQLDFLLRDRRIHKKRSLIQSFGVLASFAFFVLSGKISVILPSDYITTQKLDDLPVRVNKQQIEQDKNKRKRFSLPVVTTLEIKQKSVSPQRSESGSKRSLDLKVLAGLNKEFILTQGYFFGEIDAIVNRKRTSTIVEAVEESEILIVDGKGLTSFLLNNPGLLVLFQESIIIE